MTRTEALFELRTDLMVAQGRLMSASLACELAEVSFDTEIQINRARKLVTEALEAIYG